ncbi:MULTISPECIES: hypothetical protein [unclassified Streptomyces]|uniref:hypothetical protein n=1 Tax=unclassified Streptomyces TaxID=2593676 RepID=UPI0037F2FA49
MQSRRAAAWPAGWRTAGSALGLSESELAEALRHTDQDATPDTGKDGVEDLLSWATSHLSKAIRNKAARIRSDLNELTARREAAEAQRQAEERVATLQAPVQKAD